MDPCVSRHCPETAGGHAFSGSLLDISSASINCYPFRFVADGLHWTYTGTAFNSSGFYTDGTAFSFLRRERPHLIFGELYIFCFECDFQKSLPSS